ncbi:MAG TPA: hypothetical protein PKM88_09915 [bacterium]|nr:hypothetical protein [bacterium]
MARYFKYLAFLAVVAIWLAPGAAFANISDRPAGTIISNSCTLAVTSFADSVATANDTTVATIVGDTLHRPTEVGQGNFGETVTFVYYVYNTGNSVDTIAVSPSFEYQGTATNWVVSIGNGVNDTHSSLIAGSTWPAGDSIFVGPLNEDAIGAFIVSIGIGSASDGNKNGDTLLVRLNTLRDTMATGQYTGDNTRTYAEANYTFTMDTVTIAGAVFSITKSGTCTMGGFASTPRPGATLTYKIMVSNIGSGAGSGVSVYDQIDTTNTTFVSFSAGTGYTAQWAEVTQTNFVATNNTGWTASNPTVAERPTVRWIRFVKATVAAAETEYQLYTVTIN